MHDKGIVFFDGYCHLCSSLVQWIIRNDPKKQFTFIPLEKISTARHLEKVPEALSSSGETLFLFLDGNAYKRSGAVLRIAVRLRFPWPLLSIFFMVPRFLRDFIYRVIAKNRRRWFGRSMTCYLP